MSVENKPPIQMFIEAYAAIPDPVEYNPKWENGTGYLNGAVRYPLEPGRLARTIDPDNRKIVMVGTRFGTIAVFQRYTDSEVLAYNAPQFNTTIDLYLGGGPGIDVEKAERLLGIDRCMSFRRRNIGEAIELMADEIRRHQEDDGLKADFRCDACGESIHKDRAVYHATTTLNGRLETHTHLCYMCFHRANISIPDIETE